MPLVFLGLVTISPLQFKMSKCLKFSTSRQTFWDFGTWLLIQSRVRTRLSFLLGEMMAGVDVCGKPSDGFRFTTLYFNGKTTYLNIDLNAIKNCTFSFILFCFNLRFAGSNPAGVDGFFEGVKILSTTSPGGTSSRGSEISGSLKNLKPEK